jgi:hypothetical protein
MVYRLLYDLPPGWTYRVVFMQRPVEEVIASQEEMLKRKGLPSDDVDPATLADLYRRQLRDVDQWLSRQPNFKVKYVQYHDVLNNPESVVGALNDFLGGHLNTDAMLRIPDRSLYRQRR